MFPLWTCDTCYYPIFLCRIRWKYFYFDSASPGWPALNTEKDILVVYSKRNICFHYRSVIHVITLFFYGEYDGNIFILIWRHQNGLERREEHPGGVQQDKTSILNYLLATGCCSRTVLHQNVAVLHQDVLLGIQGHPGDEKSR